MQYDQENHLAINFADLSEYLRPFLQQIGMNSSVAEAHGLFTGILCVDQNQDKPFLWFELLDLTIDEQNVLAVEAKNEVNNYYQTISNALSTDELDFQLGINDDDSLMDRLADFSIWSQSFLYALGLNEKALLSKGSQEANDFIKDLVAISHAEEYELSGGEDDEKSLFELIEYVRMGVLLVYDEFILTAQNKVSEKIESNQNNNESNNLLEDEWSRDELSHEEQSQDEESNFDRTKPLGSTLFH